MQKLSINDFSGGIQESVVPDDFTQRQWAKLKGIIPNDQLSFETQWPVQSVGSKDDFIAVYPLPSSEGDYLVGLDSAGDLYWCKDSASSSDHTVSAATSWTLLGAPANGHYKFICQLPFPIGSYDDTKAPLGLVTGVLVHSTSTTGSASEQDALVVYVDEDTSTVEFRSFPDIDRVPDHTLDGGPINTRVYDSAGDLVVESVADAWDTTFTPSVRHHPYTYLDVNGALLPGRGIIPRANVGTMRNNVLVLGDIEYRTDIAEVPEAFVNSRLRSEGGDFLFGPYDYTVSWPSEVNDSGRVIYNAGGGVVYLRESGGVSTTLYNYTQDDTANTITVRTNFLASALPPAGPAPEGFFVEFLGYGKNLTGIHGFPGDNLTIGSDAGYATVTFDAGVDLPAPETTRTTRFVFDTISKSRSSNVATLTVSAPHGLSVGDWVQVLAVDPTFNGEFQLIAGTSGDVLVYDNDGPDIDATDVTISSDNTPRAYCHEAKVEVGQYYAVPNSWPSAFKISASVIDTEVYVAEQLNLAYQYLNDDNTGPYRGGVYFSAGNLDTFDPRAVIYPGKSQVAIRGMHVLNDTLITISTTGGSNDGVYSVRGYFSRLLSYTGRSDPNALVIQLVRGGIGAPTYDGNEHRNFSCVWSEAGTVVFIDRLGGIWYTDGANCDRLDRYGPETPRIATSDDHVAALGKHLFAWRDGRLLCFTIMETAYGEQSGCWTEVSLPDTIATIRSMVGGQECLYMVVDGVVHRMNSRGPISEFGSFDGVPVDITVSTATIGSTSDHNRVNWSRFGMTFTTEDSCSVESVYISNAGALALSPSVSYSPSTSDGVYDDPSELNEFVVHAGIGPQPMCSATVVFRGHVQLQSASFWVSGQLPRSDQNE